MYYNYFILKCIFHRLPAVVFLGIILITGCSKQEKKPNFIIILTDDQGYNDLGCFGGNVETPHIDQMAKEGIKMTSFYDAAPLCTPSRAGLMTGSYPVRVGLAKGPRFSVLLANDSAGLNPSEITIAEILKSQGYSTGIFGKWHLGDQAEFFPTRQGFNEWFGLPYSHDIHPYHPKQIFFKFPPLPLYDGEKVIEYDPDAEYLTQRFTQRAVQFIQKNKDQPFFLYLAHALPHQPIYVSPPFMKDVPDSIKEKLSLEEGFVDYQTRRALYSKAINEIDWSVGEIMKALQEAGLDKNTLVFFTSDNGPSIGDASPLRGKKGSTYEGGMRVPAIAWWPDKIPAGTESKELLTTLDLFPTLSKLTGAELPNDRIIDGKNIWPVLTQQSGVHSPHNQFYYFKQDQLQAVRSGNWKLFRFKNDSTYKKYYYELYNLEQDIMEKNNLADKYPDIVKELDKYLSDFEIEIKDSTKIRPPGVIL